LLFSCCIFVVVEQFCHKPLSSFHVFLDSSKLRHRLRRKLAEEKKALFEEIQKYNFLVQAFATNIDAATVEHSLTGESTVSPIWPWEVHGSGMSVLNASYELNNI